MSPREEQDRIHDIQERISRIRFSENLLANAEREQDTNLADTALDAILYGLIVIGEATKSLSSDVKARHPEIPWRDIAGMRDILAHEYFRINSDLVKATIDTPLGNLERACISELAD